LPTRSAGLFFACVLGMWWPAGSAQELGRLFSTADERAVLDEIRRDRDVAIPEPEPQPVATVEAPKVEQLSIDGLVIRSGGANSAWINGRAVSGGWITREGVRVDTASVQGGGTVKFTLPSGVDTVELKPGQKIDVTTGVVVEVYERESRADAANVFERPAPVTEEMVEAAADPSPPAESESKKSPASTPAGTPRANPEQSSEQARRTVQGG
jgi:hypothetical protein